MRLNLPFVKLVQISAFSQFEFPLCARNGHSAIACSIQKAAVGNLSLRRMDAFGAVDGERCLELKSSWGVRYLSDFLDACFALLLAASQPFG
jgi:hypothetical protein